ncbi:uncharacterized protein LOC108051309 [Drosophila rhopaloa]|uniref:Antennal-specific protein OS-C n=1 Tax=Drosophila rhopaloa TaxID=1041015 RepID=A0ABM5I220_DRORH|nr:uncharacterized protein LOC108051309 [Drosophila rhopaloa]
MHRSVLLLLISAFVLSAAVALPLSLEESEEVASHSDVELEPLSESLDTNEKQNLDSSVEETVHKELAKEASSSVEELKDGGASSEEESSVIPARRRRSVEQERYRNLHDLAYICPLADTTELEEGDTLNSKIKIPDMYPSLICKPQFI